MDAERFGWRAALTVEDPLSLLAGAEIHLWFLPFAALASGLAVAGDRLLTTAARVRVAAAVLPAACALPVWLEETRAVPAPFAQWCVALAWYRLGGTGGVPGAAAVAAALGLALRPVLTTAGRATTRPARGPA